jgi:hypothetical protein
MKKKILAIIMLGIITTVVLSSTPITATKLRSEEKPRTFTITVKVEGGPKLRALEGAYVTLHHDSGELIREGETDISGIETWVGIEIPDETYPDLHVKATYGKHSATEDVWWNEVLDTGICYGTATIRLEDVRLSKSRLRVMEYFKELHLLNRIINLLKIA